MKPARLFLSQEDRLNDRSRRAQKWVNEEFYKVLDVFGFRSVMFVEWGFRPADVRRTTERIKHPAAVVKQWVRTAEQEQKLAEEAEASGHRESAAEFYYRAALYYGPPCGVIHANTPRKLELYKRLIHCYTRFTETVRRGVRAPRRDPVRERQDDPRHPADRARRKREDALRAGHPRHGHDQGIHAEPLSQSLPPPRHGDAHHRRSRPGREQYARDLGHARQLRTRRQGRDRLHRNDPRARRRQSRRLRLEHGQLLGSAHRGFRSAGQGAGRRHGRFSAEGHDLQALEARLSRQLHVHVEHP